MPNYHVTKDKESSLWATKKAGGEKSSGLYSTQKEAEVAAKQFTKNAGGGEVRIHGLNGKIRDSDTIPHGNDPFPPRDKNH